MTNLISHNIYYGRGEPVVERVTYVEGKKVKKIVEVFKDEEHLEMLKSRAVLVMLKNRLEELAIKSTNA